MASRIMHLCVAKLVEIESGIIDKDSFYQGCLAPDLVWYGEGEYEISHFSRTMGNYKGIDYVKFLDKYAKYEELSDFKIGYFVHLLTDAIWLKSIQQEFVRKHQEEKAELYKQGYKDMYKYNPILVNYYNLEEFEGKIIEETMEEVDTSQFSKLIFDLQKDFMVEYLDEEFQVYPFENVIHFINEAAQKSNEYIKRIRSNADIEESEQYFVPVK